MKYIIFDLEATCWEKKDINFKHEIIEIGAIKYNNEYSKISEFNCFVKPIIEPTLSQFCKELTSINQIDIDNALSFKKAIHNFKNWIVTSEDYLLCSWGHYDRRQLVSDSILHKIDNEWTNNHISLKHQYAHFKKLKKPIGMRKALEMENIILEGIHHRGIDDARNIAKIFLKHKSQWQKETTPNKV